MSRTAGSALLIAALAALPLLASCSSGPAGDGSPSAASIAWVDGVCSTVRPFVEAAAAGPQIGGSDAKAAVAGLSAYFGRAAGALDGTITGLQAMPPAPVSGGDEIRSKVIGTYSAYRTSLTAVKTKVDAVDVARPESLASALPAAVQGLPATLDPVADLKANPELSRAVDQSAVCHTLPAVGS